MARALQRLSAQAQGGAPAPRELILIPRRAPPALLKRIPPQSHTRNAVSAALSTYSVSRVDVATGKVRVEAVDFELPGPLPLRFSRVWLSVSAHRGPLGHGWHLAYDVNLSLHPEGVLALLGDGRHAAFAHPELEKPSWDGFAQLWLHATPKGFVLEDTHGLRHSFAPSNELLTEFTLRKLEDAEGHAIRVSRKAGQLESIRDSEGRKLQIVTDASGRISQILSTDPAQPGKMLRLASYVYDREGDLVEVRDARARPALYEYANHLLEAETDRQGFALHFEYDGTDQAARCIRLFGDGGVCGRSFAYDLKSGSTVQLAARGAQTHFEWDELGLVTLERDALGHERFRVRDEEGRMLSETDPCGAVSLFEYDPLGMKLASVDPDSRRTELVRDAQGRLLSLTDAAGWVWTLERDEAGKLAAFAAPDGTRWEPAPDPAAPDPAAPVPERQLKLGPLGVVLEEQFPDGEVWRYRYDKELALLRVEDPRGRHWQLQRDSLGRIAAESDFEGRSFAYERDAAGRVIAITDETGQRTALKRDAAGRVEQRLLPDGRCESFAYDRLGRLVQAGDGATERSWGYDASGRLVRAQLDGKELPPPFGAIEGAGWYEDPQTKFRYDPIGYHEPEMCLGIARVPSELPPGYWTAAGEVLASGVLSISPGGGPLAPLAAARVARPLAAAGGPG